MSILFYLIRFVIYLSGDYLQKKKYVKLEYIFLMYFKQSVENYLNVLS